MWRGIDCPRFLISKNMFSQQLARKVPVWWDRFGRVGRGEAEVGNKEGADERCDEAHLAAPLRV